MGGWEEVFTALTRTDLYSDVASVATKTAILRTVWKEDVPRLIQQYGRGGIAEDGTKGFGFLVEAFARKSPKVPRNSAAGARLADLLIHALHTGDSVVGTGFRLSNPDLIWVKNTGRRAVIIGIGEIKSSVETLNERIQQVNNFESGMRLLLKKIQKDKERGAAVQYLALKKIALVEPLKRVLVLPVGERAKAKWLPRGWEALEIEFSYEEFVFIAQRIWPFFRPDFKPAKGYLPRYEREFLAKLAEWGQLRFNKIFARSSVRQFPIREYLLYALAVGELPLADEQVELVAACVKEADFAVSFPPQALDPASLSAWERKFTEYFTLLWGKEEKTKQYILHFLHDRRSFVARLEKILRRRDLKEALRNGVTTFDLLDT